MKIKLNELRQIVREVVQEAAMIGGKYYYEIKENGSIEIHSFKSDIKISKNEFEDIIKEYLVKRNKIKEDAKFEFVSKKEYNEIARKVADGDDE
jgi:hypothetical protein